MTRALRLLSLAWQHAGRVTQDRVILSQQLVGGVTLAETRAGGVTPSRVTLALRLVCLVLQRVDRVTLVALDCREEVLGLSDLCATSLMSISMIGRLEARFGCMMPGIDTTC